MEKNNSIKKECLFKENRTGGEIYCKATRNFQDKKDCNSDCRLYTINIIGGNSR